MDTKKLPIGVYDSGVGGLTILSVLCRLLPQEHFLYFADTANLPYGQKTAEQIASYTQQIVQWMEHTMHVKLVISACNTSSALGFSMPSHQHSTPIIGTITPLLRSPIIQSKRLGILATEATATSRAHEKFIINHGFTGEIYSIACPDLVPLIESEFFDPPTVIKRAKEYLHIFKREQLDTLLYGCTHYPLIRTTIESILSPTVFCIDPAEAIAAEAIALLERSSLLCREGSGHTDFYCSGDPTTFDRIKERYFHTTQPEWGMRKTVQIKVINISAVPAEKFSLEKCHKSRDFLACEAREPPPA